jgi:hypothetical protein
MPLNMFISHKIHEQGETVRSLVSVFNRFSRPSELRIFYSKNIRSGENYRQRIINELKNTDIFLLMCNYKSPPYINDWCSFEMGYFSSIADQDKKKLISLVKKDGEPPDPVKDLQCIEDTYDGIKKLLEDIFNNDHKPLREDLFESENKKLLDITIAEILHILEPVSKTTILAPRVWITIKQEHFEDFKKGIIPLPRDSIIYGETEVFLGQKLDLFDDHQMTLKEFDKILEFPPAFDPFLSLLGEILHKIVNAPQKGPCRVPPVRIYNNMPPRIIVPASIEKCADGNYCFEFFVTEPPPYTEKVPFPVYSSLYNLFIIGWSFRWGVIESHLKELKRRKHTQSLDKATAKRKKEKLKNETKKLFLDMKRVALDSYNRRIENETDVMDMFTGEEKEIMKNIVHPTNGFWTKIYPEFYDALESERESLEGKHVDKIIKCLKAWRDLNKTALILTLNRLLELTKDEKIIQGNLISATTTIEDLF